MADILIRNVSDEVIQALDMLARAKAQSRQDMLKDYVEILASPYVDRIREMIRQVEQEARKNAE